MTDRHIVELIDVHMKRLALDISRKLREPHEVTIQRHRDALVEDLEVGLIFEVEVDPVQPDAGWPPPSPAWFGS